jgi:hypothetical protein
MPEGPLQVGAPDPERETSPIIDEDEMEHIGRSASRCS